MAAASTRRYAGQGIRPAMIPEAAKTEAVRLIPGTYVSGQVLGQFTTWTAANDVQTLTIDYTPTGGSFRLSFDGVLTSAIAFNASVAAVQAILDAHPSIGSGQVVVSGAGALPGNVHTFTFSGSRVAGIYQPTMIVTANALTGGTPGTVAIAHTTEGRTAGGAWGPYDDTLSNGLNIAKAINMKACVVNTYGEIFGGSSVNLDIGPRSFTADVYIAGYFRTADMTGIDAAAVADLGKLTTGTTSLLSNTGTIIHIY